MAFCFFSSVYSFLRPSALPLTKNTTQAGGRDTLHVFGDLGGLVLVFRLFPGGQKAAFPDDDDAPVRHEGQRFGGGNERVGLRVGQVGQVQLLQPGGQQLRAQIGAPPAA